MQHGYGRVSTNTQDTALQEDAFKRSRIRNVVYEKWSSVGARPRLMALLHKLKPGDELIVWKLDRLGRSLQDLLVILEKIVAAGATFRSLTEPIDTRTPAGKLMFSVLGAVAEFERSMIRERSIAGQVAAIKRGVVVGGRPHKLSPAQKAKVKRLYSHGGVSLAELGHIYGVSHTTIRRAIYGDERDRMKVLRQYL
jgi:DNA invertase Pin-like site-specific DNA recombinase